MPSTLCSTDGPRAPKSPRLAEIAFAAPMLTAPRSARPATARAFADALHGVRRRQQGPPATSRAATVRFFPHGRLDLVRVEVW